MSAANHGSNEWIDIQPIHDPVPVHVRCHVKLAGKQHVHKRVNIQPVDFSVAVHVADLKELDVVPWLGVPGG